MSYPEDSRLPLGPINPGEALGELAMPMAVNQTTEGGKHRGAAAEADVLGETGLGRHRGGEEAPAADTEQSTTSDVPVEVESDYEYRAATYADYYREKMRDGISEQAGRVINVMGRDEAEQVNIWEVNRERVTRSAAIRVSELEREHDARVKETGTDPFGYIYDFVKQDRSGTGSTRADAVDASVGATILGEHVPKNEIEVREAEQAVAYLLQRGSYKLHRWNNGEQLATAVEAMARLADTCAAFDPRAAGFLDTLNMARSSLSIIRADLGTKPHYAYAMPERSYTARTLHNVIDTLAKVVGSVGARYGEDFEAGQQAITALFAIE